MEPSIKEFTKKFVELATDDFVKNLEKHSQGRGINEVHKTGDRNTIELRETHKIGNTPNFRETNQGRKTHTGPENVVPCEADGAHETKRGSRTDQARDIPRVRVIPRVHDRRTG